jgi:hypothetical protein
MIANDMGMCEGTISLRIWLPQYEFASRWWIPAWRMVNGHVRRHISKEGHLGEALSVKGVEVLVLKGLADLHHPVCSEVKQHHSIAILHTAGHVYANAILIACSTCWTQSGFP